MELSNILSLIQIIVGVAACGLAIYIPEKIKWEQRYSQLLSDYRSYDVAAAVQGIVQFFVNDCRRDVSNIKMEYERRFKAEVEDAGKLNSANKQKGLELPNGSISNDQNLHYQRRLLNAYFYELNECAKRRFLIGKKRVGRDFTKKEANIIKILYFMNAAAGESDLIFKDISTDERVPKSRRLHGMDKAIVSVYEILEDSKRYIDV